MAVFQRIVDPTGCASDRPNHQHDGISDNCCFNERLSFENCFVKNVKIFVDFTAWFCIPETDPFLCFPWVLDTRLGSVSGLLVWVDHLTTCLLN